MRSSDNAVRLTRLERDDSGWLVGFRCGDQDRFWRTVEEIKERIPQWGRQYVPEERCWWVDGGFLSRIAALFVNYDLMRAQADRGSTQSRSDNRGPTPKTTPDGVNRAFAELHLLSSAPTEVVKAAYKAMALLNHPDHGGDTERMKRINLAYEQARIWAASHERGAA